MFGRDKAEQLYRLVRDGRPQGGVIGFSDLLATLVQLTVDTIYGAYESYVFPRWEIDEVVLSGGGAANTLIVEKLTHKLSPVKVCLSDICRAPAGALQISQLAKMLQVKAVEQFRSQLD